MKPAADPESKPLKPESRPEPMSRAVIVAVAGLLVALAALGLILFREGEDSRSGAGISIPAQPASAPQTQVEQKVPGFDVVRIGNDGNTVIAGRAMPGAQVTVIDGDTVLGSVTADGRGEWVFLPAQPLPPGARELKLKAANPDGTAYESTDPVVLVVPERGKGQVLAIQSNRQGASRVLQGPSGAVSGPLSLDVVDHDDQGHLFVGGKAPPGGRVFLYLDNQPIGRVKADEDGHWRVGGSRPADGAHHIRADLVDGKGKVLSRVEVTWAAGEALGAGSRDTVVVVSGNSLWRIARRLYGKGVAYTMLFEANKSQIRDPNLIYPGQVFSVPER